MTVPDANSVERTKIVITQFRVRKKTGVLLEDDLEKSIGRPVRLMRSAREAQTGRTTTESDVEPERSDPRLNISPSGGSQDSIDPTDIFPEETPN